MQDLSTLSLTLGKTIIGLALFGFVLFAWIYWKYADKSWPDKLFDIWKWTLASIAVVVSASIISDGFKERDQDLEEMKALNDYVVYITKVEGLPQKIALSEFYACVTPNSELKRGWEKYLDVLKTQLPKYDSLINMQNKLKQELITIEDASRSGNAPPSKEKSKVKQNLTAIEEEVKVLDAPILNFNKEWIANDPKIQHLKENQFK